MQKSRIEEDKLPLARTILGKARDKKVEILLPVDLVVAIETRAWTRRALPATTRARSRSRRTLAGLRRASPTPVIGASTSPSRPHHTADETLRHPAPSARPAS